MNNSISANPEAAGVKNSHPSTIHNKGKFAHFVELTKPRISVMVLMTVLVAAFIAGGASTDLLMVFNAMVGTFLIAASGSAWNQYIKRYSD